MSIAAATLGTVVKRPRYDAFALKEAVRRVCQELRCLSPVRSVATWRELDLLYELVACLLGSRVRYEVALAAAQRLRKSEILERPLNAMKSVPSKQLAEILAPNSAQHGHSSPRYPFSRTRSEYVARTLATVYRDRGSLHQLLSEASSPKDARRRIVAAAVGVGPKQASLFLRNVGFSTELAILDSHVLRYMSLLGINPSQRLNVGSLRSYELFECRLRKHSEEFGAQIGEIDRGVWIVMRVASQEQG